MTKGNENREIAVKVSGVKKKYRLGQIGSGTLYADLQSRWAKIRGKEDPNSVIGAQQRSNGKTFMALNGVDLTIYKGEAVGIIGSNGAGKSTLLKLLSRVTAPTAGTIDIYGRIASMLEVGTGFNRHMTGRENIYLNGAILGMTKEEIDAKMEQIIEFSEVREFIDTPVKRYSSGMFVKLAFSVAAHLDAEIMIMDEVLAVGDAAFQTKCLGKMREAANRDGRTVLYVSHNMNTIRALCDRCIVLDKGKVIYDGDVEEAIGIYMGSLAEMSTEYVYGAEDHPDDRTKPYFKMTRLKILNKEKPFFDPGDIVNAVLECECEREIKDLKFRFEIQHHSGETVGTMLCANSEDMHIGTNLVNIRINLAHLTPGKYNFDMVAYVTNKFGTEEYVDGVFPGFVLRITDVHNEFNQINWLGQWWGHVRLKDVVLTD